MLHLNSKLISLIAILIVFGLIACDDSSTGPDTDDDPPPAPEFDQVDPDLDIFTQMEAQPDLDDIEAIDFREFQEIAKTDFGMTPTAEDDTHFFAARMMAIYADGIFSSIAALPSVYFNEQLWGDPDIDGNTWVWEFTWEEDGEAISMRITAETSGNFRNWELRYSYSGADMPDFENELLMSAEMALDGETGSWRIHGFLEEETDIVYEVDFEMDGEITSMVHVDMVEAAEHLSYDRDGSTSSLTFFENEQLDTYIEWDNETGEGFVESPEVNNGERACWDEQFMNTPC